MNKVLSVAKTILAWVFVVFCLLMAIGCGSVSGSILFILTAVLSVPLKIVRICGIRYWESKKYRICQRIPRQSGMRRRRKKSRRHIRMR